MFGIKLYAGVTISQITQQTLFYANNELVFLRYFDFFSFLSRFFASKKTLLQIYNTMNSRLSLGIRSKNNPR